MDKIRLGKLGRNYAKNLIFAFLCMIGAVGFDMLYPELTRRMVDEVVIGGQTENLAILLAGFAAVGLGRAFCRYYEEYTFDMVGCSVGSDVRRGLFRRIQELSLDYFGQTNTGELMARVKDDTDLIWDAFGMTGMLTVEVTIHVAMVLFCMFRLNMVLTLIPLAIMIIMGTLAVHMERTLDKVFSDISEKNAQMTTVAEENLGGVRTVKAFAMEQYEINKFLKENEDYFNLNMKHSKILVKIYPYFQFTGKLLPVFMAVIGSFFVINDAMSLGALVAFIGYSRNIVWPMEVFGELANEISSIAASYKKINKVLANVPTIETPKNPVFLEQVKGDVTFEGVGYCVGEHEILKDVSFHIEPGKTLGIMGETGSGKSSIINLLERLYDVSEGCIKLDGVDIRQMDLKQLRKSISMVMQDVFLFSDTVMDNIRMGERNNISEEEVQKASMKAAADEFISKMEDKYNTIIGERGVGLSGGQKQRISIARAFAHHCPILVLDDATSALDMETEHQIQTELKKIKDVTKIIVAHRISAVRYADEIIIMKNGRVAERGNHEELLEKKGLYYETYQAQYGQLKEVE